VSAPYRPVVAYASFLPPTSQPAGPDQVQIEKLGAQINISSSDVMRLSPPTGLDKLCADAGCYYYRKRCDAAQKYCAYSYDFVAVKDDIDGKIVLDLEGISIVYKSAEQLKTAEENVFLEIRSGEPVEIPLSRMKSSTSSDLPYCFRESSDPNCQYMFSKFK
jgi:hypothetical protein